MAKHCAQAKGRLCCGFSGLESQSVFAKYFRVLESIDLDDPESGALCDWVTELTGSGSRPADLDAMADLVEEKLGSVVGCLGGSQLGWARQAHISDLLRARRLDADDLRVGGFRLHEEYFLRWADETGFARECVSVLRCLRNSARCKGSGASTGGDSG